MTEQHPASPHDQMQRSFRSDMRALLGCQVAFPLFAMTNLMPLGLLYPFADSRPATFLACAIFDLLLAFAASTYRRKAPEATLRQAVSAWLVVIAPCFAVMFFALWLGETFGI